MTNQIELFTQSSTRIRSGSLTIYIDPFRMAEEPHDADFILITHDHYDHYSPEDIRKVLGPETVFVVPEKLLNAVRRDFSGNRAFAVKPGARATIEGLELETVPSYNRLKPFHPKSAGWVGYILTLDGERIYVAGDTDATPEARQVRCDVAMVPIGGKFTMNAREAAELVNAIRPGTAIPTHYGSIVGRREDAAVFAGKLDKGIEAAVIMKS